MVSIAIRLYGGLSRALAGLLFSQRGLSPQSAIPAAAFRDLLPFEEVSPAMLLFSASMRLTTLSARGLRRVFGRNNRAHVGDQFAIVESEAKI
jgi:hypothetical protein